MADTSLVNLGELSKPATVLIEKISDAIGGIFKPWQIRRVAQAEGEAERIKAITKIDISELQIRGLQRFFSEEAQKQSNIETITAKALPELDEKAQPQDMEDDWITNFFDKCRLISNEEMQIIWSRILAGEANSPGTYSKRTVNFLSSLDKSDATLFQSFCRYCWSIGRELIPLIYDARAEIYNKYYINFESLLHMDEIGLISLDSTARYRLVQLSKRFRMFYFGKPLIIEFAKDKDNQFFVGYAFLSKIGQELVRICGPEPIPEFYDYVLNNCKGKGLKILYPSEGKKQEQPNNTSTDEK